MTNCLGSTFFIHLIGLFLPTAAKAGIGVCAGVGALLTSVFLFLWISRLRKTKANVANLNRAPGVGLPHYCNTGELRGGFPPPTISMKQTHGPPMELDNGEYSKDPGKDLPELQG
ncbi:uncharacterized protein AFUA_7G01102 [Aspergillus fumigatus Af293]|uniref:Uncharacterized protein n=1 Tax=Aspergillus fumigatus (strain ATCC MYA-4609 / CBS 101355 / FGSC A1100 / Af293) TaxID=330879 RepID=A4DA58_ASPFU|nr:conserved hypothetical protein [Aspergillus fumigatus Af293]EBA27205.1 conserved hypothetical protein [Aspergillus fumigatus Af293]